MTRPKPGHPRLFRILIADAIVSLANYRGFNFDLDRYKEQLVAGYSRTLPDLGLEVYMLGLEKLGSSIVYRPPDIANPAAGTR